MNVATSIRRAGLTIAAGLLIQMLSLLPLHPLAFIAFVGIGMPLTAAGVIWFLIAIVSQPTPERSGEMAQPSRR